MFKLRLGASIDAITSLGFKGGKYNYKVCDSLNENLKKAMDLGFDTVDINACTTYTALDTDLILDEICEKISSSGVKINAFHMPFGVPWMDLTCPWESDRDGMIEWILGAIKKMNQVNPYAYVFHPGTNVLSPSARDKRFANLCDTATVLAKNTDKMICVENMVGGNLLSKVEQVEDLMLKTDGVGVVLDVNHLLCDKPEDAILRLKKNIKTLHISDYDFVTERHELPGKGKIEWNKVIGALESVGYEGVFNYELNGRYTLKDIKENYDKLFNDYNLSK